MSGVHLVRQPRLLRELGFFRHIVVIAVDTAFHLLTLRIPASLILRIFPVAQCHTFLRRRISSISSKYSRCSHLDASSGTE